MSMVTLDAGADHHHGFDSYKLLSLRNATYFLFAFGVTGVALNWMWGGTRGSPHRTAGDFGIGVLGATISTVVFGWLRKSESGEMPGDRAWLGATGGSGAAAERRRNGEDLHVTLGRSQELLARPFDATPRTRSGGPT